MISDQTVELVTSFKIAYLVYNCDGLTQMGDHIAAVTTKTSKRLWFLKKLKRAGVSQSDLAYYYKMVIRPVLEYASPVWHSSLTSEKSNTLEAVQRRACQIIIGGGKYTDGCTALNLDSLHLRRQQQC